MFDRKIMILAMLLVGLLALTAVSAAENSTFDIVSVDENVGEEFDISSL